MSATSRDRDLRIDGARLIAHLDALAQIGAYRGPAGEPGCCRLALTDADRAGRDQVVAWLRDLGLHIRIDAIGNVLAIRPDRNGRIDQPVVAGSHIDTVRTGGRFDGNLGVLAGLEVIQTLLDADIATLRPVGVAFFTNEEGARFSPDMLGSLVYAGGMPVDQAHAIRGIDGASVGDELSRIGYVGPAPCPGPVPFAYVELHIEQGPVLESEGLRIGAVTGVQGISWQEISITGQSNHAGTTPMALRHDAGYAAARIATFVRDLVRDIGPPQVGTVGQIALFPGLVNVIAASARLTVDLRNTDAATLQQAESRLSEFVDRLARDEGVQITRRSLARFAPVGFDPRMVALVEATAKRLHATVRRLPSGAGHDAGILAGVCPAGMIFTPSVRGISHNPAEQTAPDDLILGANVLLHTVLQLAEHEDPWADRLAAG